MNLFSINWWISTFVATFITCLFIYLLKKMTAKVQIPVVSDVMAEV